MGIHRAVGCADRAEASLSSFSYPACTSEHLSVCYATGEEAEAAEPLQLYRPEYFISRHVISFRISGKQLVTKDSKSECAGVWTVSGTSKRDALLLLMSNRSTKLVIDAGRRRTINGGNFVPKMRFNALV